MERLGHSSIKVTLDTYGHLFPALDEALTEGLDEQFQNAISNDARPERTPAVRLETPETAKCLFKLGIWLSGCRDLNSGPSVPQTGRAEPGPFHTGRKPRHDTVPDTGCRLRTTAGGPDRARNVTRRVTRAGPGVPGPIRRQATGGDVR